MPTRFATGGLAMLASVFIIVAFVYFAVRAAAYEPTRVSLRELGVLQLAAHDLFLVDRELEENLENDMLDLSTVFDHGDDLISVGGEIRNSENVAVFGVATGYAKEYLDMVEHGTAPEVARERIVRHFHGDLTNAARHLTGGRLPEPMTGTMTMTDNLAYRVIHDLLPSSVMVNGVVTPILSPSLFRRALHDSELWAQGAVMDGTIDEAFRNITFFTPVGLIVIDLIERDHSFAEQFHTDFSFQHFLDESADGRLDPDEDSTRLIRNLLAKGLGNYYAYMEYIEEYGIPVTATTTDITGEGSNDSDNGADGTIGNDGADGAAGQAGSDGENGTDGANGTDVTTTTTLNTETTVVTTTVVQSVVEPAMEQSRDVVRDSRGNRTTR